MSRTAQSNLQSLEPRVLSMATATRIVLSESTAAATAIAEEADIEVSAMACAEAAVEECALPRAAPEPLVLTSDGDLRVGWGELQEWLGRS